MPASQWFYYGPVVVLASGLLESQWARRVVGSGLRAHVVWRARGMWCGVGHSSQLARVVLATAVNWREALACHRRGRLVERLPKGHCLGERLRCCHHPRQPVQAALQAVASNPGGCRTQYRRGDCSLHLAQGLGLGWGRGSNCNYSNNTRSVRRILDGGREGKAGAPSGAAPRPPLPL